MSRRTSRDARTEAVGQRLRRVPSVVGDTPRGGFLDCPRDARRRAEVFVDGVRLPTLWRPPFRCALPAGPARTARLRIEVTNLWPNRLIGDDRLCTDDCAWEPAGANGAGIAEIPKWVREGRPSPTGRTTFTTWKHWTKKDDLPQPSGLFDPVRLVTERTR